MLWSLDAFLHYEMLMFLVQLVHTLIAICEYTRMLCLLKQPFHICDRPPLLRLRCHQGGHHLRFVAPEDSQADVK